MDQVVMQGKDAHKLPEWLHASFIGDARRPTGSALLTPSQNKAKDVRKQPTGDRL